MRLQKSNYHFNKPVAALLTAAITTFFGIQATAVESVFPDVQPGHDNYVAIQYLKENGLVEGYSDGTFQPYQEINRAEALKVLLGAIPKETESTTPGEFYFPDVTPVDWYFSFVESAFNGRLVQGYSDGMFHPEKNINKAESLKISLIHEGGFIPEEATAQPYTDVPVDVWYAPYAEVAKNRTLFLESRADGSLHAEENMNRGGFAELIYRILKSAEGSQFARATWYGSAGVNWSTASGEKFDYSAMTAAHKTLPFGTILKVTNLANGKEVLVTVNDRGPYARGIDLDLTLAAFEQIASAGAGIINTEYKVIEDPAPENLAITPAPEYGF